MWEYFDKFNLIVTRERKKEGSTYTQYDISLSQSSNRREGEEKGQDSRILD